MKVERECLLSDSLLNRPPPYSGNSRNPVFQECAERKGAVKCRPGKDPGHFSECTSPDWVTTRVSGRHEGTSDRVLWQGLGAVCQHLFPVL